jgi:hypothetical protein
VQMFVQNSSRNLQENPRSVCVCVCVGDKRSHTLHRTEGRSIVSVTASNDSGRKSTVEY